jgi:hypothetical protein
MVIPAALLDEVVEAAVEQEKIEAWIIGEVRSSLPLPGLYPPTRSKPVTRAFAPRRINR